MIWLTGRLAPDFKTIADFHKNNGKAIRKVCREFVALCHKLGLLSAASVAIDGSKFKAINARDKNFTEAKMKRRLERIEESIVRYIAQLETADRRGDSMPEAKVAHFKDKIVKLNEEIARLGAINTEMMKSKDKQISLTDPDARSTAMPLLIIRTRTSARSAKQRFKIEGELIQSYFQPYIYLNHDVLRERGLNQTEVERTVAAELEKLDGIWLAASSSALAEGSLPNTPLNRAILRNYNSKRSGDIYIVFKLGWFINDFDGLTVASVHGSPWRYDTSVPVIFVRPGVAAQQVFRQIATVDVAPTLSAILGITYPSGSVGKPLVEVLPAVPGSAFPKYP
jgi:hypothetical protein